MQYTECLGLYFWVYGVVVMDITLSGRPKLCFGKIDILPIKDSLMMRMKQKIFVRRFNGPKMGKITIYVEEVNKKEKKKHFWINGKNYFSIVYSACNLFAINYHMVRAPDEYLLVHTTACNEVLCMLWALCS